MHKFKIKSKITVNFRSISVKSQNKAANRFINTKIMQYIIFD